jgi:hypothetical protein
MPPVAPSPSLPDAEYVVIARARGKCVLCKRPGADAGTLIVPASYGGEPTPHNTWPVHERCGELRHTILGTSPEPSNPEALARLLSIPSLRSSVLNLLHKAATEHERRISYEAVDAITLIERAISAHVGVGLRSYERPLMVAQADWDWMQTGEAHSALTDACYALLRSDH